ncbi:MAG: serine/threonine-protein kinase, partial [Myxococcota bacterium]|nr:serine/threonine-protein kinase [Myxococcota bacterium]
MNPQAHTGDSPLAPNTMVDHFKVTHVLGRGGMGDVYLARDTQLGRRVALKLIRPEDLGDREAKKRFLFEARVTAQFSHPNIVTIYAVGEHAGQPYLALEYLDGESLGVRLRSGPLGTLEAARLGLAIAEALTEAHAHNILHRDLKAENVFLPKDGRLRVLDFGLARQVDSEAMKTKGTDQDSSDAVTAGSGGKRVFVGTPPYMAPEQWRGGKGSPATDVFALGVILFEMLAGQRPFRGQTWHAIRDAVCGEETPCIEAPNVPIEFKELVARCLAKQPQDRPSMDNVAVVLTDVIVMGRGRVSSEGSPFRGLLPFTEAQAGLFFGRDEEVAAFVERLRDEPLLAVVGPSGAGKSSFVQAGVVPRLKERGSWMAIAVRPGGAPFEALAAAIVRTESQITDVLTGVSMAARSPESAAEEAGLAWELLTTPGRLGVRLEELAERQSVEVLLIIDQLEELVALGAQDDVRQRFMEALSSAADDVYAPVRIVVTLRDDFLGKLAEGPAARSVLSQVVVLSSPGPSALAEIASRPLADVGYAYEDPGLPTAMAAAVQGEAASLPLLQFTLTSLWKARDRSRKLIPLAAYTALGGVEGALAGHADGVMSGLSPVDLRAAREIFLRLVTPSRTRRAVPRDELLSGLPESAAQVLDR